MNDGKTIWIVDAQPGARVRALLHAPHGPHLLLRREPEVGDVVAGKFHARPSAWSSEAADAAVTEYIVNTLCARRFLSLWQPERGDVTEELLQELLFPDQAGDPEPEDGLWACSVCELRAVDTYPELRIHAARRG